MTSLMSKMLVATAAMAVCVGMASAQSLKTEIPFRFEVSGTVMPAGSYQVFLTQTGGVPMFRLLNTDLNKPVLALSRSMNDARWAGNDTKLVFQCTETCALSQIWTGMKGSFSLPTNHKAYRSEARLVVVKAEKAE